MRLSATIFSLLLPSVALATTYQVGPSRTYTQASALRSLVQPGDVVEIDGNVTYTGGLIFDAPGTASAKITVRGIRVNGKRPIITGGVNTVEARASHYVFEALDLTGGTSRCFYHNADDVTLRDSVVHDCPATGIMGGDYNTGSMLLEYTEVYHCGSGMYSHQIYMSADPEMYPASSFRMQFCYIHDANGGNNVKSRAARNEIYYNWIEGALYHELDLIGSDGHPEDAAREDSDIVGNVFVKTSNDVVARFGGDGTGQSNARYRFVNNDVLVAGAQPVFWLDDGIDSLEFHNNVFTAQQGSALTLVRDVEAIWVTGQETIAGTHNFIPAGATAVPAVLSGTVTAPAPGFSNMSTDDLTVAAGAPIIDAGASALVGPAGHPFPSPLAAPMFLPPQHVVLTTGTAQARNTVGAIDVGAYERGGNGPSTPPSTPDGGTSTPPTADGGAAPQNGQQPADSAQGNDMAGGPSAPASGCSVGGSTTRGSVPALLFALLLVAFARRRVAIRAR